MRVYGSSPLFNYVELIFRSKRLFIVSIILATLATSGFYFSRKTNYTARMGILMTGSNAVAADASQRDTVAFKLAVLQFMLRNPKNIKDAMTEVGLKGNMSEVAFADYCKRVTASLSYNTDNTNYLEFTCVWPNRDCEKILTGFYNFYKEYVVGQTTNVSVTRTKLLTTLLTAYTKRQHDKDIEIRDFEQNNLAHKSMATFDVANQEYVTAKQYVQRVREQIQSLQSERNAIAVQLSATPQNIENTTMSGPGQAPERLSAAQARDAAKKVLDDLLVNNTPQNPKVKSAQEKLNQAQALVDDLKKKADITGTKPTPGDVTSIHREANPQYQSLLQQRNERDVALTHLQSSLNAAQEQLVVSDQRMRTAPDEAMKLKAMRDDQALYASMQSTLRSELEQASMSEMRDKELKSKEMSIVMPPEAEMEKGGARGALLLGAGPILGLIIAFCFSLLAESLDHSLRTPMEVEKYLNKPVLAVLPRIEANRKATQNQLGSGDNNRPSLPS